MRQRERYLLLHILICHHQRSPHPSPITLLLDIPSSIKYLVLTESRALITRNRIILALSAKTRFFSSLCCFNILWPVFVLFSIPFIQHHSRDTRTVANWQGTLIRVLVESGFDCAMMGTVKLSAKRWQMKHGSFDVLSWLLPVPTKDRNLHLI